MISRKKMKEKKRNRPLYYMFVDFLLMNVAYFISIFIKRKLIYLDAEYRSLLLVYLGIWMFSSLLANKYKFRRPANFKQGLSPFNRAFVYMSFMLFFVIFIFKMFAYSRFIILSTLVIYILLVMFFYGILYLYRWGPNVSVLYEPNGLAEQEALMKIPHVRGVDKKRRDVKESLIKKLKQEYLETWPELFDFLNESINLNNIKASEAIILDTNSEISLQGLVNRNYEIIVNLGDVNFIPSINKYFSIANDKLARGGYLIGGFETLYQRQQRRIPKFPRAFKKTLSFLDFVWRRVFPKVILLKGIYYLFNGKSGHVLSEYEMMGRLHFCGFREVVFHEINNKLYFIAKKTSSPFEEKQPSTGLLFKQRRIGLNGEMIFVYKLRTMYPYSEYIHRSFLEKKDLSQIGKVDQDERITGWGRILRKYWVDEFPMLINWLQGDMKMIGLRPLSRSFIGIYPEDIKSKRIKYKPGIFPAIYAKKFGDMEAVFKSEKKYMDEYDKHPWLTDMIYFFKIVFNILFRKMRSA